MKNILRRTGGIVLAIAGSLLFAGSALALDSVKLMIPANPGGGWEYPELMMVLFLSYIFTGGGAFSLDRALSDKGWLPAALRRFT